MNNLKALLTAGAIAVLAVAGSARQPSQQDLDGRVAISIVELSNAHPAYGFLLGTVCFNKYRLCDEDYGPKKSVMNYMIDASREINPNFWKDDSSTHIATKYLDLAVDRLEAERNLPSYALSDEQKEKLSFVGRQIQEVSNYLKAKNVSNARKSIQTAITSLYNTSLDIYTELANGVIRTDPKLADLLNKYAKAEIPANKEKGFSFYGEFFAN